ncbi:hypothetical protein PBI_ARROYO_29 [Microbacterium phage Arroyo]|nr:hypothetical protein QDW24_gp29 [Microbacterium phage Arroyo]YP_010753249.1 hypothetical protein QDW35_gp28 [Microbacterium phage DickRichards]YP_010753524.1 hypothetical protein QDW39_gp28 [Microbacterium phage Kenzers]YP_010754007.1 hypothetical protein QDW46_gp28 [Microbacterium phage SansAfet]QDH93446.1 hypothetical protein PBI_ARROYO_29 [Microbacterium phage Arroyo]QFP94284.1 hypothetical protein SEA_SANSAFET_28 [Microbacterium phage SansAfet]QOP66345.1 hypothetical protein SEA_DICKRI
MNAGAAPYTDRLTGGRDGLPQKSMFDIDPDEVCPGCNLVRAKNGTCDC